MASPDPRNFSDLMEYLHKVDRLGFSRRRFLGMMAGATAVGGLLSACGGGEDGGEAAGTGAAPGAAETKTPANTLVVAAPGTPSTLDSEFDVNIQTTDAIGMLYDSLIQFKAIPDPENPNVLREDLSIHDDEPYGWAVEGKLADSWELSSDGTTATFTLKQGIKSNWGNELTANDVKWTWDRKFAQMAVGGFFLGVLGITDPEAIRVESDYVVSFTTPKPNAVLLTMMVNLYNPIFDATKLQEIHDSGDQWAVEFLKNNHAGFGPYTLKELTRGSQAVFEARSDYHGEAPAMTTVVYQDVPNSPQRVALVQGGDADVAQYLRPRELQQLESVEGVRVDSVQGTQQTWIELNAKIEPFDDVRVRQAMNYAFPFQEVLDTVYLGYGRPLGTGIPTIYPFATEEYFPYTTDLDKAQALLEEAGAAGLSTTLSYNAGVPEQEEISTLYQTTLREIGVNIELNKLPAGTFYDFVSKRSEPMIYYTDAPWNPDPGYANYLYFHKDSFINYSNYVNEEVSSLITDGLEILDPAQREPMYKEAQEIYVNEAPWVFVVRPDPALAVRDNISGWVYYTSNNVRFQDFTKT